MIWVHERWKHANFIVDQLIEIINARAGQSLIYQKQNKDDVNPWVLGRIILQL